MSNTNARADSGADARARRRMHSNRRPKAATEGENLIKRHKSQLASDRTSCRSPLASQMRLILHTAAYWLLRTTQHAIPATQPLANGEFSTPRLRR